MSKSIVQQIRKAGGQVVRVVRLPGASPRVVYKRPGQKKGHCSRILDNGTRTHVAGNMRFVFGS